jgi:transposase
MANRKYDTQLKKDVIEAVLIGNKSAAQVAREHDVPASAIYSWIREYKEKHDIARLTLRNETPEQEISRLKAELSKSNQERDILKKATAYFASLEK